MSNIFRSFYSRSNLFYTQYLPRPRVDAILDCAMHNRAVFVIAGTGYGKTQAVVHYIKRRHDSIVRWLQLTENDNMGSCFWEHLTQNVYLDNPKYASRLRELGFPDTTARFKQFIQVLKEREPRSKRTIIVLDDFHLIQAKPVLTFVERYVNLAFPSECMVILSRNEPEINFVSLLANGTLAIITESELRYTKNEIGAFLEAREIPYLPENLSLFADTTGGWAIAVLLLSLVLKRSPRDLGHALGTMKHNIFKLFQLEAFDDFPLHVRKCMVRLAMLSDLPLAPLHIFSEEISFIRGNPHLLSFVWYDSLTDDYRFHPLYLEFLRCKSHILSQEEVQNTFIQAAQWCVDNSFRTDAMRYYAKAHQYARIRDILFSYPFKLPHDTCEYCLGLLEELAPEAEKEADPDYLFLVNFFTPLLLLGIGRYDEALEFSFKVIREWEHTDTPLALKLLCVSYSTLTYIDMYLCTATHKYEAAAFLEKSVEYRRRLPTPSVDVGGSFAVADIRSFACLVGEGATIEEFDLFIEGAKRAATLIPSTFADIFYGYGHLVDCEMYFFKNQFDLAKRACHQAIIEAREKKQYSIEMMAYHYLLRMSMHEGDYLLARRILRYLGDYLDNADFWNRQRLYDLTMGIFFSQIGLPRMSPPWLVMDEKEATSEVCLPTRELIVCVTTHLAMKQYDQVLTIMGNSYPRDPHERFLFGELFFSLVTAVAKVKTGNYSGAEVDFNRAYALSFGGVFETFFIECGKELHPLVVAATKREWCGIPQKWLMMIDRKAAIFAKKTAVLRNHYERENALEDISFLSGREREVLSDLYHGLTRVEIAANRHLSLSTVKSTLRSIYLKLDVGKSTDAVRTAIKKGIVE